MGDAYYGAQQYDPNTQGYGAYDQYGQPAQGGQQAYPGYPPQGQAGANPYGDPNAYAQPGAAAPQGYGQYQQPYGQQPGYGQANPYGQPAYDPNSYQPQPYAPAAGQSGGPAASGSDSYVVKRGDTLSSISKRMGVPIGDLRRLNGISGDRINAGQKLRLR